MPHLDDPAERHFFLCKAPPPSQLKRFVAVVLVLVSMMIGDYGDCDGADDLHGNSALSAEEVCGSGACVGQGDDW